MGGRDLQRHLGRKGGRAQQGAAHMTQAGSGPPCSQGKAGQVVQATATWDDPSGARSSASLQRLSLQPGSLTQLQLSCHAGMQAAAQASSRTP